MRFVGHDQFNIYEFDPVVSEELLKTEFTGKIPSLALLRLPEWCPYIRVPAFELFGREVTGMFVMLEHDMNNKRAELRMYLDNGTYEPVSIILHLGDWTVDEAIEYVCQEADRITREYVDQAEVDPNIQEAKRYKNVIASAAKRLLPLVLYLCSDSPEIENRTIPEWLPQNPKPKKIRGEIKFMPSKKVHRYVVGAQLGRELKEARIAVEQEAKSTHTVTLHVRRAHWHGYWSGPRKGKSKLEQTFSLRWLHPIMVTSRKLPEAKK